MADLTREQVMAEYDRQIAAGGCADDVIFRTIKSLASSATEAQVAIVQAPRELLERVAEAMRLAELDRGNAFKELRAMLAAAPAPASERAEPVADSDALLHAIDRQAEFIGAEGHDVTANVLRRSASEIASLRWSLRVCLECVEVLDEVNEHLSAVPAEPVQEVPGYPNKSHADAAPTITPRVEAERRSVAALKWAVETFGDIALNEHERAARFTEEAIELAQAVGLSSAFVNSVTERVYRRLSGDVTKEVGQAQLTLELLAEVLHVRPDRCAEAEFERIQTIPQEEWTRRHQAKVALGIASESQPTPCMKPSKEV